MGEEFEAEREIKGADNGRGVEIEERRGKEGKGGTGRGHPLVLAYTP